MTDSERIEELERKVAELERQMQVHEEMVLMKVCTNSVAKEMYNFQLLKILFEKLNLEVPDTSYKF